MKQRLLIVGVIALVFLAGCGGPGPGAEDTPTDGEAATPGGTPTDDGMNGAETPTEQGGEETPTPEDEVTPTEES